MAQVFILPGFICAQNVEMQFDTTWEKLCI